MANERVLVVDDEELNLLLIREFLDGEAVDLDTRSDPLQAWAALQAPSADYALVILDRMMPGLNGLDFVRLLRGDPRLADLPVIMQTGSTSPEQLRQGLAAGAYHYLSKPYDPAALIAMVGIALDDGRRRRQLRQRAVSVDEPEKLLTCVDYRFSTLDDVALLVPGLAALCPQPAAVAPGLLGLMVNAVEHGNLGVGYQEKKQLQMAGRWAAEIRRRQHLPQFGQRLATIRAERLGADVVFTIADQGNGFAWQQYSSFDPERLFDPNGRGIALAKLNSFARVDYPGAGNVVVATAGLSG